MEVRGRVVKKKRERMRMRRERERERQKKKRECIYKKLVDKVEKRRTGSNR